MTKPKEWKGWAVVTIRGSWYPDNLFAWGKLKGKRGKGEFARLGAEVLAVFQTKGAAEKHRRQWTNALSFRIIPVKITSLKSKEEKI